MIMKALKWLLIATVVLAIYKIVGGDFGDAVRSTLEFFYDVIDHTSDFVVNIFTSN